MCVTAATAPSGRFAAGFLEPVGEHGFGVIGGPLVGQHVVETWIVVVQAEQQPTTHCARDSSEIDRY
jgi:hypothetical protein